SEKEQFGEVPTSWDKERVQKEILKRRKTKPRRERNEKKARRRLKRRTERNEKKKRKKKKWKKKWQRKSPHYRRRLIAGLRDNKSQLNELDKLVGMVKKEVKELEIEKARMEGRLEERKEIINMFKEAMKEERESRGREGEGPAISFAEVVRVERRMKEKRPPVITGTKGELARTTNVVLVRKEGRESEEVRKKLKELIDPRKENINVRKMMRVKDGVMLEVNSKEEVKRLIECEGMKKEGIEVKAPYKKKPMVMIYDIDLNMKDEVIVQEIYERNLKGEIEKEEMSGGFKIRNRMEDGKGDRLEAAEDLAMLRSTAMGRKLVQEVEKSMRLKNVRASQLNSRDLGFMGGEASVIYVNYSLTMEKRKLLNDARKLRRDKRYTYIWVDKGRILMRKNQGDRAVLINNHEDLDRLLGFQAEGVDDDEFVAENSDWREWMV
ncbi:hypothetical protein J6590_107197, partial [Homalodisca vitripennis]